MTAVPISTNLNFVSGESKPPVPVVRMQIRGKMPMATVESIACPGMAPETLARVREAAALWRDDRYRAKRLATAIRDLNLPGLTFVFSLKKRELAVPPPLAVPFEPIELDETHPSIPALAESAAGATDGRADAALVPARTFRRWFVRFGAPAIILFNVGLQAVIQTITQTAVHGFRFWFVAMWGGILLATVLPLVIYGWYSSAQWFIVPGGVVLRRSFAGKVGKRLELFTPADTILQIGPDNLAWVAVLARGKQRVTRRLTQIEATALLGAWQSRLRTPEAGELVDLI